MERLWEAGRLCENVRQSGVGDHVICESDHGYVIRLFVTKKAAKVDIL